MSGIYDDFIGEYVKVYTEILGIEFAGLLTETKGYIGLNPGYNLREISEDIRHIFSSDIKDHLSLLKEDNISDLEKLNYELSVKSLANKVKSNVRIPLERIVAIAKIKD